MLLQQQQQHVPWSPSDQTTRNKYEDMKKRRIRLQDLDSDLYKVLHYATREKNDLDFMKELISFHKKFKPDETVSLINQPFGNGNTTALMVAAAGVTQYLLDEKADPNIRNNNKYGNTVYHWAVWDADLEKLRILLQNNSCGTRVMNNYNETPLDVLNFMRTEHKHAQAQRQSLQSKLSLDSFFQQMENVLKKTEKLCLTQQQVQMLPTGSCSRTRSDNVLESESDHSACTESRALSHVIDRLVHGEWDADSAHFLRSICDAKLREQLDANKTEKQALESKVKCLEEEIRRVRLENVRLQTAAEARAAKEADATELCKPSKSEPHDSEPSHSEPRKSEPFSVSVAWNSNRLIVERYRSRWKAQKDKMQRDILNSVLQNLTDDLYSSRTHFISEMIQNAVDSKARVLYIVLADHYVCFGSNGEPIRNEGVKALCSIGFSTKKGGNQIGQKGIGFKSVFCASHSAIIRSGGMSFSLGRVSVEEDEVARFLTPEWVDNDDLEASFRNVESALRGFDPILFGVEAGNQESVELTFIHLNLKSEVQVDEIRAKTISILNKGASLLVLGELCYVGIGVIEDGKFVPNYTCSLQEIGAPGSLSDSSGPRAAQVSHRIRVPENFRYECPEPVNDSHFSATVSCFESCIHFETSSSHGPGNDQGKPLTFQSVRANVLLKNHDKMVQDRWRKDVRETTITFCFPQTENSKIQCGLPLYAFLPIENYKPVSGGFSFLFHADWILTSNREALKDDDRAAMGWNTLLREISAVLIGNIFKDPVLASMTGVQGHLQLLFQQTGLNTWWECFLQKIAASVNSEGKVFRATDSIVQDFEILIPSIREKMNKRGYIVFDCQKKEMSILADLTLCALMQLYDDGESETFNQIVHESRQKLFAFMNKYINDCKACTNREKEIIREILLKKAIFRCFPLQGLKSLERPHYHYLFSKDPKSILEFSWPNQDQTHLSIPGRTVIHAENLEEEQVYGKLGLIKCTIEYVVNQIQAHHAAFFGHPLNQDIDADACYDLAQQTWFLYQNRDSVRSILADRETPFPVLYVPVDKGGKVLPAKQAVLPSFLGLEISMNISMGTDQVHLIDESLFRKGQDHQKQFNFGFELFLLEMGCDLPPESSLIEPSNTESYYRALSEKYADSALVDLRRVQPKLVSNRLEKLTVVERIKELVRCLAYLKKKDQTHYLEVLRNCQSMDLPQASKDGGGQKQPRKRQVQKWDHLVSKDVSEYRKRLENGYAAEDEAFKWLEEKCTSMPKSGSSVTLQISFAEHNDDGYDIVINGQLPGKEKLKCCIEVKGISKYSETGFIYISKNEYLKMQASLNQDSEYDYVVLIVDEVSVVTDPTQHRGRVCGYCDAQNLLSKLNGWTTPQNWIVDDDVESTEFRVGLTTLKEKEIFFKPDELFENRKGVKHYKSGRIECDLSAPGKWAEVALGGRGNDLQKTKLADHRLEHHQAGAGTGMEGVEGVMLAGEVQKGQANRDISGAEDAVAADGAVQVAATKEVNLGASKPSELAWRRKAGVLSQSASPPKRQLSVTAAAVSAANASAPRKALGAVKEAEVTKAAAPVAKEGALAGMRRSGGSSSLGGSTAGKETGWHGRNQLAAARAEPAEEGWQSVSRGGRRGHTGS